MPNRLLRKGQFEHVITEVWKKAKANFVHKYEKNTVLAHTELSDAYILGEPISVLNNTNATGKMSDNDYFGSPSIYAKTGDLVEYIVVGIDSTSTIGSKVTSAKFGIVRANDRNVLKKIDITEPIYVKENVAFKNIIGADRIAILPINETMEHDSWFMVGVTGMKWNTRAGGMQDLSMGGSGMPNQGSTTNNPTATNWMGQVIILGKNKSLNNVVTKWGNLEHVREASYVNLLDYSKRRLNSALNTNGTINPSTGNSWNTISVDIEQNSTYTVFCKHTNNMRCAFHNAAGGVTQNYNQAVNYFGGWYRRLVTVPTGNTNTTKLVIEFDSNVDSTKQIMMIKGDHLKSNIIDFIPYNQDLSKIVIGKEVSIEFDNSRTDLKATTVTSAIEEIDSRMDACVNKGEAKIVIGGHTALVDANVVGRNARHFQNRNLTEVSTKTTEFFTCDEFTASGDLNITQITIAMDENIPAGTVVDGVNVAVATYSGSNQYFIRPDDIYMSNERAVVYETTNHATLGSRKAITVDIDIPLTATKRLVIGAKGMRWGQSNSVSSTSGENFPTKGATTNTPIQVGQNAGKAGSAILHADETKLGSLIKNVRHSGAGTAGRLTFYRADGRSFDIPIASQSVVNPPVAALMKLSSRVGETRSFVYDISQIAVPKTFSTKTDDEVLDVEDDLPVISNLYPHITGTKIEVDGGVWLKCTGQQLDNLISGKTITLPTSKEFDYMFICLGAIDYEQETQPSN